MAENNQASQHGDEAAHKTSPFLKRHKNVLPIVGALIVFTTFIINEGMREHLRGLVQAIEFAQTTFLVARDNGWNRWTALRVQEHVDLMRMTEKSSATATKEEIAEAWREMNTYPGTQTGEIMVLIQSIQAFTEALPVDHDAYVKRIYKFTSTGPSGVLEEQYQITNLMTENRYPSSERLIEARTHLWDEQEKQWSSALTFGSEILKEAEQIVQNEKRRYKAWTWASYILYLSDGAWGCSVNFTARKM